MKHVDLFISDLHLDAVRPAVAEAFFAFLREQAGRAARLYILGDLFELWLGDDDDDPFVQTVIAALAEFAAAGPALYIMRGNRDFLLGDDFARAAGATLIDDPTLIESGGEPVLLMHGDTLCTDDTDYQAFRAQVRQPQWMQEVLAKPLAERRALGRQLREQSATMSSRKPADIMDVNNAAVREAMAAHGVRRLIHGHTHRPATHALTVDGETAERIVLGDWHSHGWCYRVDKGQRELLSWEIAGGE